MSPSSPMSSPPSLGRTWRLAIGAWAALVLFGLWVAGDYAATAGTRGEAPVGWPLAASFAPSPGKLTLVMFAHPRCPCTRASLSELDRLMSAVGDRAEARVLFARPASVEASWTDTDLVTHARRIPHTQVIDDPGGREAALFGALTSGHLFVFDEHGVLQLSGGLTAARGHEGPSLGREDVLALVSQRAPTARTHEVFGCPISTPTTGAAP